jgi:hypothetical protein
MESKLESKLKFRNPKSWAQTFIRKTYLKLSVKCPPNTDMSMLCREWKLNLLNVPFQHDSDVKSLKN